jgi:predicted ATPase
MLVDGPPTRRAPVLTQPPHADAREPATLDLLSSLVDRSLVVAEPIPDGTIRYRLHEVVRQFRRGGCS